MFWFQINLRRPDVCSDGVLSLSCSCCRVSSRVFPALLLIQLFLGRQVHCLACSPWQTEPPWRAPVHSPEERVHVNKHLISQKMTIPVHIFDFLTTHNYHCESFHTRGHEIYYTWWKKFLSTTFSILLIFLLLVVEERSQQSKSFFRNLLCCGWKSSALICGGGWQYRSFPCEESTLLVCSEDVLFRMHIF